MAVAQIQCPNCHRSVPADAHSCPHCGVYLQLPGQAGALPSIVQTPSPAPLPRVAQFLPDALKQLDTAATTNVTISGVLIAFYAGAIFAGKVQAPAFNALIYALPVVLLLITIILSIRVFYPAGYLSDDYSALLRTKETRLRYSSLLLEISVAVLALAVFVYLLRP